MSSRLPFAVDQYQSARGSWSRWKKLWCRKCETVLGVYQKDGPGDLYRSYLDRFAWTPLSFRQQIVKCPGCDREMGLLGKYRDEDRPALLWLAGAVLMKTLSQEKAAEFVREKKHDSKKK